MTNAAVVDTNVVSYLFKHHSVASQYIPDLKDRTPMISFMTVAELDRWVLEVQWGVARRKRLRQYLLSNLTTALLHEVGRDDGRRSGGRAN